jgi:hypothetical protein
MTTTPEQRAAAFRDSKAILALEHMLEPAGYATLRQQVIDGTLSIAEAVERVVSEAKRNAAGDAAP